MLSMLCSVALAGAPFGADLPAHMQHHFADATNAAWYVALGDLQRAREAARRLDHDPSPAIPAEWGDGVQQMRIAARAVAEAPDLAKAAAHTVELSAACAACHTASGKGPRIEEEDAVIPRTSEAGRHGMAAYYLWVGLVVPSDRAYQAGAAALLPAPSPAGARPTEHIEAYQALAGRAPTATGAARGTLWTELITSCTPCHQAGGVQLEL